MSAHTPVAAAGHVAIVTRKRHDVVRGLVERESRALLDYFVRRTQNPDDAADLLGETLLVLWRREASIPLDEIEARMWMFGVARRVLFGHRRSGARRTALSMRLGEQLAVASQSAVDARSGDDRDAVREAIAALPEIDREIVRLVYWDGFTLAEVARIMSLRAGTVRSRMARARERLRGELGG